MLPSGRFPAATPPGKPVAVPGILKINQCVTSSTPLLIDGSGSCSSNVNDCVPIGTCVQLSTGEGAFGTACVNLSGITPPSWKSGDVRAMPGAAGALAFPSPFPLSCVNAQPAASNNAKPVVTTFLM